MVYYKWSHQSHLIGRKVYTMVHAPLFLFDKKRQNNIIAMTWKSKKKNKKNLEIQVILKKT